jgi:hypothetical protein
VRRFSVADQALLGIYHAIGVERDHDLTMRMWLRPKTAIRRDANGMFLPPPSEL